MKLQRRIISEQPLKCRQLVTSASLGICQTSERGG
jgi:hypothetical protein